MANGFGKPEQAVVEEDWDVKLLRVNHPDYGEVFVAKLTSKWGGTDPIFCLPSDFHDSKRNKQLTNELMNKGRYSPYFDQLFIAYIDNLKRQGNYVTSDPDYDRFIASNTHRKVREEEADVFYRAIVEHVNNNPTVFPSRVANDFDDENSHGVMLDDENSIKKFGRKTVAFVPRYLRDLLGISNTKKLNGVFEVLKERGVFCWGSCESRQTVTFKDGKAGHAYVFYIDESEVKIDA